MNIPSALRYYFSLRVGGSYRDIIMTHFDANDLFIFDNRSVQRAEIQVFLIFYFILRFKIKYFHVGGVSPNVIEESLTNEHRGNQQGYKF